MCVRALWPPPSHTHTHHHHPSHTTTTYCHACLSSDASGFISINEFLQCEGGPPDVFAAGDVASSRAHPRPKAGVFAVRQARAEGRTHTLPVCVQVCAALLCCALLLCFAAGLVAVTVRVAVAVCCAVHQTHQTHFFSTQLTQRTPPCLLYFSPTNVQGPPLADNIRRYLTGVPLQRFVPQSTFLSLITTGGRHAVGVKGPLGLQGDWLWRWKDYIDRSFMDKYGRLLVEQMESGAAMMAAGGGGGGGSGGMGGGGGGGGKGGGAAVVQAAGPEALALVAAAKMRCGGCGAKVGASVLSRALARLPRPADGSAPHVLLGLDSPDDAAVLEPPPPGHLLLQTVDFFRSFWDDPYLFGRIAANHALGVSSRGMNG